jgi:hypothetical protein
MVTRFCIASVTSIFASPSDLIYARKAWSVLYAGNTSVKRKSCRLPALKGEHKIRPYCFLNEFLAEPVGFIKIILDAPVLDIAGVKISNGPCVQRVFDR